MCEMLLSSYVKYELPQSIHWPSRMDCFVIALAERSTRARQASENRSIPYVSMSRLLLRFSSRSTCTSTQSPWQSKPFW